MAKSRPFHNFPFASYRTLADFQQVLEQCEKVLEVKTFIEQCPRINEAIQKLDFALREVKGFAANEELGGVTVPADTGASDSGPTPTCTDAPDFLDRHQVVSALMATSDLPLLGGGRTNHRTIYESGKGLGIIPSGHFFIDYATFPGGTNKEVPRSVIDELEREGLIVPAFPDIPEINAWVKKEQEPTRQARADTRKPHGKAASNDCGGTQHPPEASPVHQVCNRHSDCNAAEERLLASNPGMTKRDISLSFHCHDDECEDCFGC